MPRITLGTISLLLAANLGIYLPATSRSAKGGFPVTLRLTTTAFQPGGTIPRKHTCDGPDVSPPLAWDAPAGAVQSFALIVDDPDAPAGTWVHWVLFDLPAATRELPEGVPATSSSPPALARVATTSAASATAALAHRLARRIATSSSSTPWMLASTSSPAQPKRTSSAPCRDTSSPRASSSAATPASVLFFLLFSIFYFPFSTLRVRPPDQPYPETFCPHLA